MKSIIAILFAAVLFSQILVAQENSVKFGFGVNFTREIIMSSSGSDFGIYTLPIDLANFSFIIRGNGFRIEPSLGYFSSSSEYTYQGFTSKSSSSNFRVGTLLAYNNSSFESMNFYYGLNFGAIFTSTTSESPNSPSEDHSKTDFFIGPAIGGEFMINDHFSLGGEINVNYISIGDYDDSSNGGDLTQSAISSRGIIYVRWYVN